MNSTTNSYIKCVWWNISTYLGIDEGHKSHASRHLSSNSKQQRKNKLHIRMHKHECTHILYHFHGNFQGIQKNKAHETLQSAFKFTESIYVKE